jgi:hypothetical protein
MTTQELERELISLKQSLQQLQITVDRMSVILSTQSTAESIKWLSLIGVGKEIWKDVDTNAYVDTERNAWN